MSAEQRRAGAEAPGGHTPSVFTAQQRESRWRGGGSEQAVEGLVGPSWATAETLKIKGCMVRPTNTAVLLCSASPCFTYTLLTRNPDPASDCCPLYARTAPSASLLKGNICPHDGLNLRAYEGRVLAASFLGNCMNQ